MVGIVVVSHSYALASAAVSLASEMVPAEARPPIAVAAGLDETTFGTDAMSIADAITRVDSDDGVLVLLDLGSAVLSAEMACEFLEPDVVAHVKLSAAPLVEGLVAAVVTASTGASLEEVAREAESGLIGKRQHLGEPAETPVVEGFPADGTGLHFSWVIRNPHGLHARPAGVLVSGLRGLDATIMVSNATSGSGPVSAGSVTMVQTLGLRKGDEMIALISGPEAEQARERLESLAASDFGEASPTTPPSTTRQAAPDPKRTGRDIVIGAAHHVSTRVNTDSYTAGSIDVEATRLDQAIAIAHQSITTLNTGANSIADIQLLMLKDDETIGKLKEAIRTGASATTAVRETYDALAAQLEAVGDPYFAARAEDQRGLERILLRALMGQDPVPAPSSGVIILDELDPLTAGSLDPTSCEGVITTSGGATGHGVILAQSRGFAVLTGRAEAEGIPEGQLIAFDPVRTHLWIDPTAEELAEIRATQVERLAQDAQAASRAGEPAVTASGTRILVEANISSVDGAHSASAAGAEGSGLVRTEILFASCAQAPSTEEQAKAFIEIGQALGSQPITVRTWDPGGDKPLSFLPQEPEANPMLGERGIRAMRRLPSLLDAQLEAVLIAGRTIPVRVMFPMISSPDEIAWARTRYDAVRAKVGGETPIGMMVETPSAAIRAADFVDLVDFISIGTNDLTQYAMAADRGNAVAADLTRGPIDAVWDLIAMAASAFSGKPVCVCGDLASDPALTARLIGLGVTELSVRAPLVGVVKQAVRAA